MAMNEDLKKTLREYLSVDHVAHFGVCYFVTTMIFAILFKYPIWAIIVGVMCHWFWASAKKFMTRGRAANSICGIYGLIALESSLR